MTGRPESSSKAFQHILEHHLELYGQMAVEDLYKLVFQAAMGAEHAVTSKRRATAFLMAEARSTGSDPAGPVSVPLSPDHSLVRIHIVPYLLHGGGLRDLSAAHVQTSREFVPSSERLERYWSWAMDMAARQRLPFSTADLKSYGHRRRSQGYPAVHHSPRYRRLYAPAYRVVLKEFLQLPSGR